MGRQVNEARLGIAVALAARGLPVWTPGVWPEAMQQWGGPAAVRGFRAAVHVPYAPTTFALFEHAQAGLVTFIPTPRLLLHLYETRGLFFQVSRRTWTTDGRQIANGPPTTFAMTCERTPRPACRRRPLDGS